MGRAEELGKYFSDIPCEGLPRYRLKPEGAASRIGGKQSARSSETLGAQGRRMVRDRAEALNASEPRIATGC